MWNVQNRELDVNVQNLELDVNVPEPPDNRG